MTRESEKSKIRMSVIVDGKHINSLKKADEVIDQIFDEFGEKLQDKDDEIELLKCRIEEAMKLKTCVGCKQSWKPNNQTFHKYFCEYLRIPIHGDFCCNKHEQKV